MSNFPPPPPLPENDKHARDPGDGLRLRRVIAEVVFAASIVPAAYTVTGYAAFDARSPDDALDLMVDITRVNLGESLCPEAPNETETKDLKETIERADRKISLVEARANAEAAGLHFTSPTETLRRINESQSAEDVTQALSEFAKEAYGFEVDLDIPEKAFSAPTALTHYKILSRLFARYVSLYPNEVLQTTNIKSLTIGLYTRELGREGWFHYRRRSPGQGEIGLDINLMKSPLVFSHEILGHAIHHKVCKGYYEEDPNFTQLNAKGYRYMEDDFTFIDSFATPYASWNLHEDIAINLVDHLFKDGRAIADLTPKRAVVLSRIEDLAPGTIEYLTSIRWHLIELEHGAQTSVRDYDYREALMEANRLPKGSE